MQTLELEVPISTNHEIHLKLPDSVTASVAKIIVMYENKPETGKKRVFGQYRGQIKISDSFDDELPLEFWLGDSE